MKQNSKAGQRIRELKKASIAARMPQIEQEQPSRSFLSNGTKAKIGAATIAAMALFAGLGATSCNNSTSPTNIPKPSHPDNIGYIPVNGRNIDIRVPASANLDAEQKENLITRLEAAFAYNEISGHANIDSLKIIRIIGFDSEQGTRKNIEGGIIEAVVHPTNMLSGLLFAALNEGWPVAYNSNTNTIHIAGANKGNQRG